MKTKGELYDYLRRTADKVFLNADNPYLCRMAAERELHNDSERPDQSLVIPYGLEFSKAKVLPSTPEEPFLRIGLPDNVTIRTNLIGSYNADNVMAALAVGEYFGISSEDGIKAIEAYVPSNKRSQMTRTERNTLIIDAYNANPTSMEAALKNFSAIEAQHKIAMLGDMLELGDDSLTEHIRIAGMALDLNADKVCFVGKEFEAALENMGGHEKAECFPTSTDLAQWLESQSISNTVILIKGSRGTRMENVIETL
jgi:UDP-N-acetylmuramoyl-tripeptide--D-alanyl-D-alanine ligase